MKYVAYTTKGLEEVIKLELQQKLREVSIEEIGDKRIIFETGAGFDDLIQLKTVDDLGIFIGQITNIKNPTELVSLLDKSLMQKTREFIKKLRQINNNTFSVTVSIAKSSLKASEVLSLIQKHIIDNLGWDYVEQDHSNFDIRVFIDGKSLYISIRLTKESMHNRVYKLNSKSGSLKPTVAAAMVILATNFQKKLKVVDNFCGSGTILCEACLTGNEVYGGDLDSESVDIARKNLNNLGYDPTDKVKPLDAKKTNWANKYFDCAISNLPWDKQIEVESITDLYENSIKEYFIILKPKGTLCAIITKPELFIKYVKRFKPDAKIRSIKIGLLGQNPTIIIAS